MAQEVKKMEGTAITTGKPETPHDAIKSAMLKQKGEFLKVLPSHITFEKFQRTVMTAITQNPELMIADRQSLLLSSIKAATDGLLPDARDAALVIFNAKIKDESGQDRWIKKVQYMPMYAGILKKIRQSGELSSVVSHVVYERDKFEYFLGDDERITHEPYMGADNRGAIIAAYCIAKLKDGSIVREVMTFQDIEKVRRSSKAGNDDNGKPKGIWSVWYEEMARKTVFRRCAKWLPQSVDMVDRIFENDDSMKTLVDSEEAPPLLSDSSVIEGDAVTEKSQNDQPDLKEEIQKKKEKKAPKPEADPSDFDRIKAEMIAAPDLDTLDKIWSDEGVNKELLAKMLPPEWNKLRSLHDDRNIELIDKNKPQLKHKEFLNE